MEIAQPFPGRWTIGSLLSTAGEEKRLTPLALNTQGAGLGRGGESQEVGSESTKEEAQR